MSLKSLEAKVRSIPDFPKKGVLFRDITPLLKDAWSLKEIIARLAGSLKGRKVSAVVGIESRGFIFGTALATKLGVGFVPIRKKGKLPWRTKRIACTLEYGQEILEIHQDAVKPGEKVVIVDDLLATGGTAAAAAKLVESIGGKVVKAAFVIELGFLGGRGKLKKYDVFSLIKY
ncbi:MAG TPA: adenine phosphoribosyltransferase [Candidatus Omnitrophota bacterium]|nr:adenine phosphoribosyltransferase [Candidatus Omnitrophota bacterium]HRY85100.1 adenine phosphoribosyltransferase [Candidatus Omnitrophota bacterium]